MKNIEDTLKEVGGALDPERLEEFRRFLEEHEQSRDQDTARYEERMQEEKILSKGAELMRRMRRELATLIDEGAAVADIINAAVEFQKQGYYNGLEEGKEQGYREGLVIRMQQPNPQHSQPQDFKQKGKKYFPRSRKNKSRRH